jgi:alpha-beta hydrolase superfamily lysophospholipase
MQRIDWHWKSRDGLALYAQGWSPESPKAVVVLIHGHGEHTGRYAHVAAAYGAAGYALLGFDLRGHGKSEGQRGHTPSYQAILDDMTDFIGQACERYPNLPVFLYGHSMGGNLVANYVLRFKPSIKGALVTSPWLRLAFEPPTIQKTLAQVMQSIYPSFSQATGLDATTLSRDQAIVEAYKADPLVHGLTTARAFFCFFEAGFYAIEHAAELTSPMLLMHGTADRLTSAEGSKEFAQKAGKTVTLKLWDGFFHETHNEPEKAQVIQTMLDWFETRL